VSDPASDARDGAPPGAPGDLTEHLVRARRGLRSDVVPLAQALGDGRVLVPLQKPIPDVNVGVEVELQGDLTLSPHLLLDSDDLAYVVVFSRPELLEEMASHMGWQTAGGPLEFCALPGRVALDVALELVDGENVVGLLFDPMASSELMLQRHEIASLAQGRALPLVGYVAQIPPAPDEKTLVAELDEPPPPEMAAAIEAAVAGMEPPPVWRLTRTFNAERDLEPHWTLVLTGGTPEELVPVADTIAAGLEGRLPPPGYIDILFDDEPGP
jgi:hypothetical protein